VGEDGSVFELDGRRALVTGGSSGIGRAMAEALVGAGAEVVLVARTTGPLERTAAELGPGVRWVAGDVAVAEQVFTDDPDRAAALAARTLIGRNGTTDDFRGVAVFLCSDASAFVTGQAIAVDGGFSAS
jgi:gluconate 5-dehydrogenase